MMGSTKVYPSGRALTVRRHARIVATGAALPEEVVTNQDLIREFDIIASDRAVQFSLGIQERRRAAKGVAASKYLCDAAEQCMARAGIDAEQLDRILYCRVFGDHFVPATALRVLQASGRPTWHSGHGHQWRVQRRGARHGSGGQRNQCGRRVRPRVGGDMSLRRRAAGLNVDTRTIFLNGDGFAAVLLGASETPRFKCSYFYTDSDQCDMAYVGFGSALANGSKEIGLDAFNLMMPDGPKIQGPSWSRARSYRSACWVLPG